MGIDCYRPIIYWLSSLFVPLLLFLVLFFLFINIATIAKEDSSLRLMAILMNYRRKLLMQGVGLGLILLMSLLIPISSRNGGSTKPKDVIVDTDVDVDDVLALLYLLKQPRSLINLKAVTINTNAWADSGHAVNHIYDILHMMGRDDIPLGIGGEGGIDFQGRIGPNVGGYLPLIDQGDSTAGECRYRQAIPVGQGGHLDIDTLYGIRKQFLPQGERHYVPLKQPTAQEVMLEALQSGPTVVLLIGSHTNFAITLMTHPEVKKNIEHIYIMGGGVNSSNPSGCCPEGSGSSCMPTTCGIRGNIFSAYKANPWTEYNIFLDPFSAYQVLHSGIPTTLVSLDATNTIPVSEVFFSALVDSQDTIEAQYVYQTLKMVHDTWRNDQFFTTYYMWDYFTAGVTVSGIKTGHNINFNEFADLAPKNITVVTSNKPYGVQDGSNPFFNNRSDAPKFNLDKNGVHSGHVQTGLQDPFCLVSGGQGKCMDGYTMETPGSDGVSIQVAQKAKPNPDSTSELDRSFYKSFLDSLNDPSNTARYNFTTEFSCYKEVLYLPKYQRKLGKALIFDMDMSPSDFITLLYLLKLPRDQFDLKAVTVTATGWANAATIDIVYDVLHMMGRDDIPVGLGEIFSVGQVYTSSNRTGDCKYRKAVPCGAGGLIDSDTLFGLARDLPRSPRRYTAHNSIDFGAPRDTEYPSWRQPKALEVVTKVLSSLGNSSKVTILTGGPLTNIATLLATNATFPNFIEEVFVTGGSIELYNSSQGTEHMGNVFTVPQNGLAEFNFFLDPIAAQRLLQSNINITFVPLAPLNKSPLLGGFMVELQLLHSTPESTFISKLLHQVYELQCQSKLYSHTGELLGEVLAAAVMAHGAELQSEFEVKPISVSANGVIATDGWTKVDYQHGNLVRYVTNLNSTLYYLDLLNTLNEHQQSAVVASFADQKALWNTCAPLDSKKNQPS